MNTTTEALSVKESDFLPESFSATKAKKAFHELEMWTFSKEALVLPSHVVEQEIYERGREVQRLMLQAHLEVRGRGEKGPFLEVVPGEDDPIVLSHRRVHDRRLVSLFGEVKVWRMGYGRRGEESIHPLDEELELPGRSFSYELTRRLVKKSVQGPFDEAIEGVKEITGVEVPKRSGEQILLDAAFDFDAFYDKRTPPEAENTGPIVVAAVDSKGIPMVKKEKAKRVVRRTKGKRANKKRMATVAAVFTQKPRIRTPEEVVESLFKDSQAEEEGFTRAPRNPPEHKRVWASLNKGKDVVIEEVGEEMERRDPKGKKKRVVVTDGERAIQKRVRSRLKSMILILDLLHVTEKLWKAAHALYPEGSEEAKEWTQNKTLRILRGEVSQVVKGMRRSATTRKLPSIKKKVIRDTAKYFYRNRSSMRYHEYLREGFPIASGAVEGACKNLIKDRMERSGMRWTEPMAEAMLRMRATYISGDFDIYWDFHIRKEQNMLYSRRWKVPISVVEK